MTMKLDDTTERLIGWVAMSGHAESQDALRRRIVEREREAVEEATRGWLMVGPASTIFPKDPR